MGLSKVTRMRILLGIDIVFFLVELIAGMGNLERSIVHSWRY